ncbi:MAG: hypothetical protein COA49_07045 [Bacteroidetes bacterium]|nr:MAG: hypothetical protein COA49_07045 [Bacteroidota bacterium]
MKQSLYIAIALFVFPLFSSCCDDSDQNYIIIDSIEVINYDEGYFEDDLNEGFPELFAIVRTAGVTYFTSEISYDTNTPAAIDFEGLLFIGEEMNEEVEIMIFDDDEATTEDLIGTATFIPGDLLLRHNRRETIQGGFLEIDLLLKWECDS